MIDTKGPEQHGVRYGIVLQSDDFALLSTCLVAPTSLSARPATFRAVEAALRLVVVL